MAILFGDLTGFFRLVNAKEWILWSAHQIFPEFCLCQLAKWLGLFFDNSILLHSGLNPAWHFWLSTRFSCCLKMKSVENILGYVREQFYRFSRGCKPRENLWNCSRKYTEMFKTDSFLGNKKLSFNQNVWRDHATMQQDVLLHFWVIFLHWNQAEIWKDYSVVQL